MGIGIPYPGSKKRFANQVLDVIQKYVPDGDFYDVCGGGASISAAAQARGYTAHYNEIERPMYELVDYLLNHDDLPFDWYDFLTKEQFNKLRQADSNAKRTAQLLAFSFGVIWNCRYPNYYFGQKLASYKQLATNYIQKGAGHDELQEALNQLADKPVELPVLDDSDVTKRRKTFRRSIYKQTKKVNLCQVQNMERLDKIREFAQKVKPFDHRCGSLYDLNPTSGIVYVDPPYRDSIVDGQPKNIDYEDLYEWFRSLRVPAFMSEYNAPREFECVWTKPTRSLIPQSKKGANKRVEKLFWNGIR